MRWRYIQMGLYYLSYLVFPVMMFLIWACRKWPLAWYFWVFLVFTVFFVYARFLEPQQIKVVKKRFSFIKMILRQGDCSGDVQYESFDAKIKVAVISDLHLGVYKGKNYLARVVEQINLVSPDLVLIPGDLIYDPSWEELRGGVFADLQRLKAPVIAVTGNHDAKIPGYVEAEEVRKSLRKYGVKVIDNQQVDFEVKGGHSSKFLKIYGLSDLMEGQYDLKVLKNFNSADNNLILAHNPDAAYTIPDGDQEALIVSGHTHGGQIRIPLIYKWVIPCKHDFDRGWYDVGRLKVLVTSGLGEVGLPLRLGVPPEIVMLELDLK